MFYDILKCRLTIRFSRLNSCYAKRIFCENLISVERTFFIGKAMTVLFLSPIESCGDLYLSPRFASFCYTNITFHRRPNKCLSFHFSLWIPSTFLGKPFLETPAFIGRNSVTQVIRLSYFNQGKRNEVNSANYFQ